MLGLSIYINNVHLVMEVKEKSAVCESQSHTHTHTQIDLGNISDVQKW